MASFGYQPSLFEFREDELAVPLVQANLPQKHLAAGPHWFLTLDPAHAEAGQIGGGLQPHHIIQVRKFGCPRKILPSTWTPRSWPEVSFGLLRWIGSWTLLPCTSNCCPPSRCTPSSACLCWSWCLSWMWSLSQWGCGLQFLVHWEGYSPKEQLWVPCCYILGDGHLRSIYQEHPDKPGRVPGGAHWGWSTVMILCLLLLLLLFYFSPGGHGWECCN